MGEKMRKSNLTNIDPKKARVSREESRLPTPSYPSLAFGRHDDWREGRRGEIYPLQHYPLVI